MDEFCRVTKEKYPDYYKYNSIYAEESSKIRSALNKFANMNISSTGGSVPEIKEYTKTIIELEQEIEKKKQEELKNYWGLSS